MLFASKLGWLIVAAVVRGKAICKKIAQRNSASRLQSAAEEPSKLP
jgi:hypothetical protein